MKLGTLIFLFIGLFGSAQVWAEVETCLLSYERAIHPVSKHLVNRYADDPTIELIIEARPVDLLHCVELGVRNIVLIAHAVSTSVGEDNLVVSLGYYKRLEGEERDQYIAGWSKYLKDKEENKLPRVPKIFRRPLQRQKRLLDKANADSEFALYGSIRVFLPRIFDRLYDLVVEAPGIRLETIHIMACETEELQKRYPALVGLRELGVQLKFAPKNKIVSAIKGHEVTSLSRRWIRKAVLNEQD